MKSLWSRQSWLRMGAYGALALLVALLIGLLSVAYGYMPPEDRTDTPAYLRGMQQLFSLVRIDQQEMSML